MGAKAADMLQLLPQAERDYGDRALFGPWRLLGVKKGILRLALKVGRPVARKASEVLENRR